MSLYEMKSLIDRFPDPGQDLRGLEIPKSNGKTRMLVVLAVTDRMLQQAVGQV